MQSKLLFLLMKFFKGVTKRRDNAARFRQDKSLLNLIKVRDGNDVEPKVTQIRAIELARIQENVEENENNEGDMENIN